MVVAASASTASTSDENEITFASTVDNVVAEAPSTADEAMATVKSGWQHGNGRRDNEGDEDDILTWPRTGMTWKGGLCRYDNMIAIVSSLGCLLALLLRSMLRSSLAVFLAGVACGSCFLIVFLL